MTSSKTASKEDFPSKSFIILLRPICIQVFLSTTRSKFKFSSVVLSFFLPSFLFLHWSLLHTEQYWLQDFVSAHPRCSQREIDDNSVAVPRGAIVSSYPEEFKLEHQGDNFGWQYYDVCIVGVALLGAVIAEQYATQDGKTSLVLEKRNHIGGNCYDFVNVKTGIWVSKYRAHLFHIA